MEYDNPTEGLMTVFNRATGSITFKCRCQKAGDFALCQKHTDDIVNTLRELQIIVQERK